MIHSERLRDLPQITGGAAILHDRGAADDLQIGDLGQARQHVVLNAIGEKGVFLLHAQIFKWQHRDAFFRNRICDRWCGRRHCFPRSAISENREPNDQYRREKENELEAAPLRSRTSLFTF